MFVLDEADEMLSRGFKDQIRDIFKKLKHNIQVYFYLLSSSLCCLAKISIIKIRIILGNELLPKSTQSHVMKCPNTCVS